jgi:hypothetical protein
VKGGIRVLSKDQFCKMLVKMFSNNINRDVVDADILQSSELAVAMEHLGMIKEDWARQYASERGGTLFLYIDEEERMPYFLTVRELLDLLPA